MHKTKHELYYTYHGIVQRCYNENRPDYDIYGGRGIRVCKRWLDSFWNFVDDMGERIEGYSIDRIDNDGDYTPDNCRWATHEQQQNNKRSNMILFHNGKSQPVSMWTNETGISASTIRYRVHNGWSIAKTLTTPTSTYHAVTYEYNGQAKTLSQWAKEYGMKKTTLVSRLCNGKMTMAEALATPVAKKKASMEYHEQRTV